MKIGFEIIPQTTPSAFVRYMLQLWPVDSCAKIDEKEVLAMADTMTGLFWKGKLYINI